MKSFNQGTHLVSRDSCSKHRRNDGKTISLDGRLKDRNPLIASDWTIAFIQQQPSGSFYEFGFLHEAEQAPDVCPACQYPKSGGSNILNGATRVSFWGALAMVSTTVIG